MYPTTKRKFRIVDNKMYGQNFVIGQIVELVRVYDDGVYELRGELFNRIQNQDVHPIDVVEVYE